MIQLHSSEHSLNQSSKVNLDFTSSHISTGLSLVAYPLGRYLVLPAYFGHIEVIGRENLPKSGPVVLAPTHRSRWDALMVPYAAGQDITGRSLRFMVSANEMRGLQGWVISNLGGFPINPEHPSISSLRHGVELLQQGETLVLFPEGGIFRNDQIQPLKPGLSRIALQAESSQPGLGTKIVPISIKYSQPIPDWSCDVEIRIGSPLHVATYLQSSTKQGAKKLTNDLEAALKQLHELSFVPNRLLGAIEQTEVGQC